MGVVSLGLIDDTTPSHLLLVAPGTRPPNPFRLLGSESHVRLVLLGGACLRRPVVCECLGRVIRRHIGGDEP